MLPEVFYDSFAALTPGDRQDLARVWLTRGLTLAAPMLHTGNRLRMLARQRLEGRRLSELAQVLISSSSMTHEAEHRIHDRLLAMIGDIRRNQHARVAEGLVQVADAIDDMREVPEDNEGLDGAGNLSSVAISTVVRVRALRREEIVEQIIGNTRARLNAP